MRKLNHSEQRRFSRALTIEYAIIMMVIVTAFIALILFSATLVSRRAANYSDYIELKAFLDETAQVYIEAQDKESSLNRYRDNTFGCEFTVTDAKFTVVCRGKTLLTVELDSGTLVSYRYGA